MAVARHSQTNSDAAVETTKPVRKTIVKKKVVKKAATKVAKKPATKKIAKVIMPSSSEWFAPRDPRPMRLSATERLNLPPPADGPLLVARVANAIERELTQIEIIVGNKHVPPRFRSEAERRARTLASLARTLSVVTQLREKNLQRVNDDDDSVPCDLDELRETLARRLDRLVAEPAQSDDREPDAK